MIGMLDLQALYMYLGIMGFESCSGIENCWIICIP